MTHALSFVPASAYLKSPFECVQAEAAAQQSLEMTVMQERLEEVRGQLEDAQYTVQVSSHTVVSFVLRQILI